MINFQIRTDQLDGLLFFIYGSSNVYLHLELRGGSLYAEISTEEIHIETTYPAHLVNICDGHWHTLHFYRSNHNVSLYVDNGPVVSNSLSSDLLIMSFDSYLYFGGIPKGSPAEQFITDNNVQVTDVGKSQ